MKKLPKFRGIPGKKKIIIVIALGLTIIVIFLIVAQFSQNDDKKLNEEVVQKIDNLKQNENVTCQNVIDELGGAETDKLEIENRKTVLESQMSCFASERQFDQAIAAAEQLKELYSAESNSAEVERIDSAIKDMQATKQKEEAETNGSDVE